MLQIQPDKEIIVEFILNDDYKYTLVSAVHTPTYTHIYTRTHTHAHTHTI